MRTDGDPKNITLHPEFLAAVQDAETYEAAVNCAKGQGWPAQTVVNANIATVIQSVGRGRAPNILVVDVDGVDEPAVMVGQLVRACTERSRILVLGSANDVAFYRGMLQAGAADYLVKPVGAAALRDAIGALLSARATVNEKGEKKKPGALHVFLGVRGGVGATTVAVNVAWLLAHEGSAKTALIDLDLHFGNCDLALDLEPARGLREVLTTPDRMDALLVSGAMSKESDNLSVFCTEEPLEESADFDIGGPLALVRELQSEFDHIVVDVPRHLVPRQRRLIVSAEHITLVTNMTLAGIRDTQRVLSAINSLGTAARIHVVVGHVGDGEEQISRSQFERSTRVKVDVGIPHDTKTIKLSANRGKTVFAVGAGGTALARSLREIAVLVAPDRVQAVEGEGGFVGQLLGKLSLRKG